MIEWSRGMIDGLMDTLTNWLLPMRPDARMIITWGMTILMPIILGVAWYAIASIVNWTIRQATISSLNRSIRTSPAIKEQEQRPARLEAEQLSKATDTIIGTEKMIRRLETVGMLAYVAITLFLGVKMNMMANIVL